MKSEYETVCADAEEILHKTGVHLPLTWIVGFLLDYAETGFINPEELQNIAEQICLGLESRLDGDEQQV